MPFNYNILSTFVHFNQIKQFKQSKFSFVELEDSYHYKTILLAKHIRKVKGSENILAMS